MLPKAPPDSPVAQLPAPAERILKPPPADPKAFFPEHPLGALTDAAAVAILHERWTYAVLAPLEELDFSRSGWADEEACELALVLPVCCRLQRLKLQGNQIGSVGASALAAALTDSATLSTLKMLALDNNVIGDAGAASLFQVPGPELKTLTLLNNEITEASVGPLAKVHVPAGALKGAAKIALEGNPCSKKSRKDVKKALKKRKTG